jgi:hypothetical protein
LVRGPTEACLWPATCARRRGVELLEKPTPELVRLINRGLPADTNVILHVTC